MGKLFFAGPLAHLHKSAYREARPGVGPQNTTEANTSTEKVGPLAIDPKHLLPDQGNTRLPNPLLPLYTTTIPSHSIPSRASSVVRGYVPKRRLSPR